MKCPRCGKDCWDNTEENKKRVSRGEKPRPDYSCKDKEECGWIQWPPNEDKPKKKDKPVPPGMNQNAREIANDTQLAMISVKLDKIINLIERAIKNAEFWTGDKSHLDLPTDEIVETSPFPAEPPEE